MIQDIEPHVFHNEYTPTSPKDSDIVFGYDGIHILMKSETEFYTYGEIHPADPLYLFKIDDISFYASDLRLCPHVAVNTNSLRTFDPSWMGFAAITGKHIVSWMNVTKYCGKCGSLLVPDKKERAMRCPSCGNIIYPRIMPAVIVAVTNDKGQLLVTKYAHGSYHKYALVAGFNEIGESLEETCKREVLEETGLHIKNLQYYKSQPWAFSSTILAGFYATVEGDDTIRMDENELRLARWADRDETLETGGNASLTSEMIQNFKENKIPELSQ